MHAWQELTLARVERRLGPNFLTAQRDAARDILYRIGQPHFPAPRVTADPCIAGQAPPVALLWVIDERFLAITIRPDGGVTYDASSANQGEAGDLAGADDLGRLVSWLLFGPESLPAPGPNFEIEFNLEPGLRRLDATDAAVRAVPEAAARATVGA